MTIHNLDILLSQIWTSWLFHVWSNCCFSSCIKVSQGAGKVVWYSQLLKNFPQFVVIHTFKSFSVVNEAEINSFLKFLCFPMIQWMLAIWSLIPLPFLNPAWACGCSQFMHCWSLAWRILSITLLVRAMSTILQWSILWHCLFVIGMKTDLFQSCGYCWVFQYCWDTECSTLTASSLRLWNSSAGISSPPLALFVIMLPKAHLTSHSRMSGSRWVIMPSWLSRSLRPFLYGFSVYSCHLFLNVSASDR